MYKHDVYISFSGTDYTLDDFVHQLSNALRRKRIRAFADPKRLKSSSSSSSGEEFGAIPDARKIEKSKIAIVVLSRKYASTAWCLDELLQILRCGRERGQVVIPVFDGEFPVLAEERLGSCGAEFLEEARAALEAIADVAGWNSRYWEDSNVIEKIVNDVLEKLESSFWARAVSRLFSPRLDGYRFLIVIIGVLSAISGSIFFIRSSFFKLQFHNTKISEIFFFGILSALLVFLVFMAPNWSDVLHKVWNIHYSTKLAVEFLFMGIVWMLSFLIKYPRFDINSEYRDSCILEEQGKEASHGSQYTLYSVGAFSLLAVLLSSERQKVLELGFFGILIGLIMDTSIEIPTTKEEPNLWYILGSVIYCVGLILVKHCIESSSDGRRGERWSLSEAHLNSLVFFSALVGVVFLYLSSFSEQQFEDSAILKGVCFITLSFLLGFSLLKAQGFIDILVTKCHQHYLVKAGVRVIMFTVLSGIKFLTKYPRFNLRSKLNQSCKDQNRSEKFKSQRNQFDVYSTGSFSLFALTMSSRKEQPVKLGIYIFLLELTMDASIEILGNDEPNFFCMVFSTVYCLLLILVKSYLDKNNSVRQQGSYQDLQEVLVDLDEKDR